MANLTELKAKRDELFAILKDEQDQLNILNEHYHLVSVAKDEVIRQIAEIEEGPKSITPPTIEAVAAKIAEAKAQEVTRLDDLINLPLKEVAGEPIKEVITEGIIK